MPSLPPPASGPPRPPVSGRFGRAADARDTDRLMTRIQSGDPTAFRALYESHFRDAVSIALRYLRDPVAAEDVAQEVFISVWRHRHRYRREQGSARAWMTSIAHNRAIDATRRARARPAATDTLEDWPDLAAPQDVPLEVEDRDRSFRMRSAVAGLPRAQREVIALGFYGGLTQEEIASRTGAPLGTVKGRSRLALAKLRQQIAA